MSSNIPSSRLKRIQQPSPKRIQLSPEAERFVRAGRAAQEAKPSPDPKDKALPAWMTSPRMVFWAIILCAFFINEVRGTLSLRAREAARKEELSADCLSVSTAPGEMPSGWKLDSYYFPKDNTLRNRAFASTEACTPDGCSRGEELKSYREDVSHYLGTRMNHVRLTYKEVGPDGLPALNTYYSSDKDHTIIFGARDLIRNGKIDPKKLGDERARYLELVVKNWPEPVPTCLKPTRP